MKSAPRALSVCQRLQLKLDQMTEPKTRERLKGSNFGTTHSVLKYLTSSLLHHLSIKIKDRC